MRRDAYLSGLKSRGLSDKAMIEKGDHRIEGGAMAMKKPAEVTPAPHRGHHFKRPHRDWSAGGDSTTPD